MRFQLYGTLEYSASRVAMPPVEITERVSRRRRCDTARSYIVVVAERPDAYRGSLGHRPLLSSRSEPAEPIKKCSAASEPPPPFRQNAQGGTPQPYSRSSTLTPCIAGRHTAAPLTWRNPDSPRSSPSVAVNRRYSASPN